MATVVVIVTITFETRLAEIVPAGTVVRIVVPVAVVEALVFIVIIGRRLRGRG